MVLRSLNYVRKNLSWIHKISIEEIENPSARYIARLLLRKYEEGYKTFDTIEQLGMSIPSEEQNRSIPLLEILASIDHIEQNTTCNENEFDELLVLSGLRTKSYFSVVSSELLEYRRKITQLVSQQFEIEGFPIPIIRGKLNSIVAPSHSGKTIYAIALAITLARAGYKILYLSTEEDIDAVIERTMKISIDEPFWERISLHYEAQFNRKSLENFLLAAEFEKYDFVVIDYLKKSMWDSYNSDHVTMEEINSTILQTLAAMTHKLSVFAFVQANREAYQEKNVERLTLEPQLVATYIDGGMPVYRSADNVLFIVNSPVRSLIVCKSRRNSELFGKSFNYDVNLTDFTILLNDKPQTLFDAPKTASHSLKKA